MGECALRRACALLTPSSPSAILLTSLTSLAVEPSAPSVYTTAPRKMNDALIDVQRELYVAQAEGQLRFRCALLQFRDQGGDAGEVWRGRWRRKHSGVRWVIHRCEQSGNTADTLRVILPAQLLHQHLMLYPRFKYKR